MCLACHSIWLNEARPAPGQDKRGKMVTIRGVRRDAVEERVEDLEYMQEEQQWQSYQQKKRLDMVLKETVWIVEGSESLEQLYKTLIEGKENAGWLQFKNDAPQLLAQEIAETLAVPVPFDHDPAKWPREWNPKTRSIAKAFSNLVRSLTPNVITNIYAQDKWDAESWENKRIPNTFKIVLRYDLRMLTFAQAMRDEIDEALRRAAGLPVWSDKLKEILAEDVEEGKKIAAQSKASKDKKATGAKSTTVTKKEDDEEAAEAETGASNKDKDVEMGDAAEGTGGAPSSSGSKRKLHLLMYAPKTDDEKDRAKRRKAHAEAAEAKGKKGKSSGKSKSSSSAGGKATESKGKGDKGGKGKDKGKSKGKGNGKKGKGGGKKGGRGAGRGW